MPNVTIIPATKNIHTKQPANAHVKRRVAGYARVSTDSDEQFTSYEAQIDYYTQFITAHADWTFVEVYTDEGISGLNSKKQSNRNKPIYSIFRNTGFFLYYNRSLCTPLTNFYQNAIPFPNKLPDLSTR